MSRHFNKLKEKIKEGTSYCHTPIGCHSNSTFNFSIIETKEKLLDKTLTEEANKFISNYVESINALFEKNVINIKQKNQLITDKEKNCAQNYNDIIEINKISSPSIIDNLNDDEIENVKSIIRSSLLKNNKKPKL